MTCCDSNILTRVEIDFTTNGKHLPYKRRGTPLGVYSQLKLQILCFAYILHTIMILIPVDVVIIVMIMVTINVHK